MWKMDITGLNTVVVYILLSLFWGRDCIVVCASLVVSEAEGRIAYFVLRPAILWSTSLGGISVWNRSGVVLTISAVAQGTQRGRSAVLQDSIP